VNGSLKLGTAFGVPIFLHWSFLVLAAVLMISSPAMIVVLPILCGCVLLHELGHSVVAQRFGIRVMDITLLPIGGMARMAQMPENARIEGLVAIAGPAVNFGLALLGYVVLVLGHTFGFESVPSFAALFITVNLILGLFNLLPAFPMDGGRILRAFLARRGNWLAATESAVRVGRWVALAMLFGPFVIPALGGQNFSLPLIALFVWFAGGRELISVRLRHGVSPFKGVRFGVNVPGGFGREGGAGFGQPEGAGWPGGERMEQPLEARATSERDSSHIEVEPGEARRPAEWEDGEPGAGPQARKGFGEEEIKALERFHGRMRRGGKD
jgi:Zn-dependent protease